MSTTSSTVARAPSLPSLPPPVLPADVKSATDRFVCPKMHATLTARECKTRYATAQEQVGGKPSAEKMRRRLAVQSAAACRGCTLGPATIHPKVQP